MDNAKYTQIEKGLNDIDEILLKLSVIKTTFNEFSLNKMIELERRVLKAEHRVRVNRVLIFGSIVINIVFLVTLIIIFNR